MLLRHVTIDCTDAFELASWWSRLTGWPVADGDEPGDEEVLVEAPSGSSLLFIQVPESKIVKNRIHFDWVPTESTRDAEVDRALALGARLHEDHRVADGRGWVTLRDPEGNEFCIERAEHERDQPRG